MHTILQPEPEKVAGRTSMTGLFKLCPGEIPLKSEETKHIRIQRNQRVKLPTIREEILLAWDDYRLDRNMRWEDI